jgi:hypothetical protein
VRYDKSVWEVDLPVRCAVGGSASRGRGQASTQTSERVRRTLFFHNTRARPGPPRYRIPARRSPGALKNSQHAAVKGVRASSHTLLPRSRTCADDGGSLSAPVGAHAHGAIFRGCPPQRMRPAACRRTQMRVAYALSMPGCVFSRGTHPWFPAAVGPGAHAAKDFGRAPFGDTVPLLALRYAPGLTPHTSSLVIHRHRVS